MHALWLSTGVQVEERVQYVIISYNNYYCAALNGWVSDRTWKQNVECLCWTLPADCRNCSLSNFTGDIKLPSSFLSSSPSSSSFRCCIIGCFCCCCMPSIRDLWTTSFKRRQLITTVHHYVHHHVHHHVHHNVHHHVHHHIHGRKLCTFDVDDDTSTTFQRKLSSASVARPLAWEILQQRWTLADITWVGYKKSRHY